MPVTNLLKSTCVICLGAFLGYSLVKYFNQPNESNRGLASVTYSKLGSEQFSKTLFQIKISNETLAENKDEVSVVYVNIEALKSIPEGLTYNWNLPDTVTIVEGDLAGPLAGFASHDVKEFRLKVKGYSREVRNFISFTVKGNLDNKQIERDVLVSSRPEDSFEYVVQEHEKERAIEEAKGLKKWAKPSAKSPIDIDKVSF